MITPPAITHPKFFGLFVLFFKAPLGSIQHVQRNGGKNKNKKCVTYALFCRTRPLAHHICAAGTLVYDIFGVNVALRSNITYTFTVSSALRMVRYHECLQSEIIINIIRCAPHCIK